MHSTQLFFITFTLSIGINLLMFLPAFLFKTDKLTDISYVVTFIVLGVFGFLRSGRGTPQILILTLLLAWAVRLGAFLLIRVWKRGRDMRFDSIRGQFWTFLKFWIAQGISVYIIMLAATSAFASPNSHISWLSWAGAAVFLGGLILEAVADVQKFRFGNDPRNKGRWIDAGVWRISRHPNYLGEMLVWVGMYCMAAPSLSPGLLVVAALSPLFIIFLLRFISGIPPLEKSAAQKWGSQKAYQQYLSAVPLLIPTPASVRWLYR